MTATYNKRSFFALTSIPSLAAAFLCAAAPALAGPATIYKETFGFCTASIGSVAADEAGWFGLKSGRSKARFGNLKVFSFGSSKTGGSVNSEPRGLSQGYSFWYKPTYGLTVLTREFQFDAALLGNPTTVVEYDQRLSGINGLFEPNRTQLAFLINGVWYISEQGTAQNNGGLAWESVAVFPSALRYGTVSTVGEVGPEIPLSYSEKLPEAGTVQAFGVFLSEVNGRVRIENFTIKAEIPSDASVSTEIGEPDISSCPITSPDRGGIAPATPTPGSGGTGDGDEDLGGPPDQIIPEETPPPQLTPAEKKYAFCAATEQGQGRGLRFSPQVRRAILKNPRKPTLVDLRDRAILTILAQKLMPIGALVNARVANYNLVNKTLILTLRSDGVPTPLKLGSAANSALNRYVTGAGLGGDPAAPLFLKANTRTKLLDSTHTACMRDLRAMVMRRARLAKLSSKRFFVSVR